MSKQITKADWQAAFDDMESLCESINMQIEQKYILEAIAFDGSFALVAVETVEQHDPMIHERTRPDHDNGRVSYKRFDDIAEYQIFLVNFLSKNVRNDFVS